MNYSKEIIQISAYGILRGCDLLLNLPLQDRAIALSFAMGEQEICGKKHTPGWPKRYPAGWYPQRKI
jgi:hypothetical protein